MRQDAELLERISSSIPEAVASGAELATGQPFYPASMRAAPAPDLLLA